VLREYLSSREKEVVSIMMALFDQEKAVEQFGYEKKQEGREEGRIRQAKKTAINMLKDGESMDKIAKFLEIPIHLIQSWAKEE
jgi:predicted transposase YdaD